MDTLALKLEMNAYLSEKNPIWRDVYATIGDIVLKKAMFSNVKDGLVFEVEIGNFQEKKLWLVFEPNDFLKNVLEDSSVWKILVCQYIVEAIVEKSESVL